MSARGRGRPSLGKNDPKGPLTRSRAAHLNNDFETPINSDQHEEEATFENEVEEFVNEQIEDPIERARRGLELLNRSPSNSVSQQKTADPPATTTTTNKEPQPSMSFSEVDALIAERLDTQTRLLTEQFGMMMYNCMADFRRSQNNSNNNQPQVPPKNTRFAASSEQNNSQDSYQNLFTRASHANENYPSTSNNSRSNYIRKEDLAEIKFDGKNMGVKQFLFKLKTLKEANDVSDEYIVKNFYRCVKDNADTWYWNLVQRMDKANLKLTWVVLKDALENDFGGRQTDADISNRMWNRKQKYNESFEDFFQEIIKLNSRNS